MQKLLLCLILSGTSILQSTGFHLFTIGTDLSKIYNLQTSCTYFGIPLAIVGLDQSYVNHHTTKINLTLNYLSTLPDEDIVMFVDGYDVVFLASEDQIIEKFLSFKAPFVMGAETNCYHNCFTGCKQKYPLSPTRFRYINTGCFIGYVSAAKEIFAKIDHIRAEPLCSYNDDQLLHHILLFREPNLYKLDTSVQLVLNLFKVADSDVVVDPQEKKVYLKETGTYPLLIHGNGDKRLYSKLCAQLFPAV